MRVPQVSATITTRDSKNEIRLTRLPVGGRRVRCCWTNPAGRATYATRNPPHSSQSALQLASSCCSSHLAAATSTIMAEDLLSEEYSQFPLLSEDERAELSVLKPTLTDGMVDREELRVALTALIPPGRLFESKDHLKQFLRAFAGQYGFHINVAGCSFVCGRNGKEDRKKKKPNETLVSPSRQRNRESNVKVGCPFVVRFSQVNQKNRNGAGSTS